MPQKSGRKRKAAENAVGTQSMPTSRKSGRKRNAANAVSTQKVPPTSPQITVDYTKLATEILRLQKEKTAAPPVEIITDVGQLQTTQSDNVLSNNVQDHQLAGTNGQQSVQRPASSAPLQSIIAGHLPL